MLVVVPSFEPMRPGDITSDGLEMDGVAGVEEYGEIAGLGWTIDGPGVSLTPVAGDRRLPSIENDVEKPPEEVGCPESAK